MAMIEHVRAVDNLAEILQVVGLDAIMVGPYDLSASMGLTARCDHPQFEATMQRIRALSHKHRIPSGVHLVMPEPALLETRLAEGYRFIAYSIDAVFLNRSVSAPNVTNP